MLPLAPDTPLAGLNGLCLQDFWELPVIKKFDQPEYYIGQTVLHRINLRSGEILHPVKITGLNWTGVYWQYGVSLPPEHPQFRKLDHEADWLDDDELEPM